MTEAELQTIGVVGSADGFETSLVRHDGQLRLLVDAAIEGQPEQQGALVAAVRRAKNLSHGRLQTVWQGQGFSYCLELEPGDNLAALIAAAEKAGRNTLPADAVNFIAFQIAEGLAVLHEAGQAYGLVTAQRIHLSL